MLVKLLLLFVVAYALVCLAGRKVHRHFVYVPDKTYVTPEEAGLEGVREVRLKTPDGVTLIAWYKAAPAGKPTLLYFTGNGGSVATHAAKFAEIVDAGYGLLMLNYRGYGGSEGRPTEADNVADAGLAYAYLREQGVPADEIVAYGESLGTSVATQLATGHDVKALVLEAPFNTIVDVGRRRWWFLPLRLVMVDQYRSQDYIGDVRVPLFVVHGTEDSVIPLALAEKLFAAAKQPKEMEIFPEADHNDLYEYGAFRAIDRFLQSLDAKPQARSSNAKKPATAKAAG
ncbi:alpha/beta fold hydrolase [Methyloligella sp. 2.7D]|uniref:alpha/beta hydrolase n=1 Tax=unclassified Methyloligella TaxID=2625955 RepID=UPI00157DBF35|nr:alpha/beta fold hydrolase [Methyloligella sp. GL2]QKP76797.1 alpha/beta hydrolase [Methyloligella sp. GL2]